MVCPPAEKSARSSNLPSNNRPFMMPPAAFAAAAFQQQRMEQFLAMSRVPLGLPFPPPNPALLTTTNTNAPTSLPNTTIFPPLLQQQALFLRQYQQFFQQQQLSSFLQKLEEIRAAKAKSPQTVSVWLSEIFKLSITCALNLHIWSSNFKFTLNCLTFLAQAKEKVWLRKNCHLHCWRHARRNQRRRPATDVLNALSNASTGRRF